MAERILILGAGVYQVPLIAAARRRGLETMVASRPGPYPGIAMADTFLPLDIADANAIVGAACEHEVGAVATAGADAGLPALGRVVDKLGLPGPGATAADLSADKVRMKAAFAAANVPTAGYDVFTAAAPAREFAAAMGYPVMVKPPDSSGSRGVIRVSESGGFAAAWREALSHSHSGTVIVERFLGGREYGAQAIIHRDRVEAVFIHEDTLTSGPQRTPVGHAMPTALSPALILRTDQVIAKAVAALGLRDCVANVDLILDDNEPHIIEIGGRMGATGIPEMINLFTGCNLYDHVLDLALGIAQPLSASTAVPNAVTLLRSTCTGRVLSLVVPPDIRNHPHLVDLQWDVALGDEVHAFRVGPDRIGQLQVTGSTAGAAAELAETLRMGLEIEVEESS